MDLSCRTLIELALVACVYEMTFQHFCTHQILVLIRVWSSVPTVKT